MLEVQNLSKEYLFKKHFYLQQIKIPIFQNISFSLNMGEDLIITGESGSGKSTFAKILAMLEPATSGNIYFNNQDIFVTKNQKMLRKHIQYVFQDQKLALNPYKKVKTLIQDVYNNFSIPNNTQQLKNLCNIMEFEEKLLELKPQQLSGGQAQRLGLIRAFIVQPTLLVLDEITSGLGLDLTFKIIDYLYHMQQKQHISYIFITHEPSFFKRFNPKIIEFKILQT